MPWILDDFTWTRENLQTELETLGKLNGVVIDPDIQKDKLPPFITGKWKEVSFTLTWSKYSYVVLHFPVLTEEDSPDHVDNTMSVVVAFALTFGFNPTWTYSYLRERGDLMIFEWRWGSISSRLKQLNSDKRVTDLESYR